MRKSSSRCASVTLAVGLSAALVSGAPSAAADNLLDQRDRLAAEYRAELDALAAWCREEGLTSQAEKTRSWLPPRHARLRYVFLPPARQNVLELPADAPPKEAEWLRRLAALRRGQAEKLLELARQALTAGRISLALELANEALREDPDHAELRRIFGYVTHTEADGTKTWRTSWEAAQLAKGLVWHRSFGWLAKDHVVRYEGGERLAAAGKWVTAAADAAARRDIDKGWKIETEHFSVLTNHGLESGVALAARLERLHEAWRQVFAGYRLTKTQIAAAFKPGAKGSLPPDRRKYQVTFFRNNEDYRRALRGEIPDNLVTTGIYLGSKKRAYFFHDADGDDNTLYHEVTHQFFSESPAKVASQIGQNADFWIVEGIACYMESLAVGERSVVPGIAKADIAKTDIAKTDIVEPFVCLGGIDAVRVQDARYYLVKNDFYLPLAQLTRLGMGALQRHPEIGRVYAQSAAIADFLMHAEDGRHRDGLIHYLKGIYQGRSPGLAEAVGVSLGALDEQYKAFQKLSDGDLRALRPGGNPKFLALCGTAVTDAGLEAVKPLAELQWIDLFKTNVTDEGLAHLTGLTKLRQLDLSGTRVSDGGLRQVARLTGLQNLMLGATPISDDGLRELAPLKGLAQLALWNTNITDDGLTHLAPLASLRHLDLSGCGKISDDGLTRLAGLRGLETLDLSGTPVTADGVRRLQMALPKCKITR